MTTPENLRQAEKWQPITDGYFEISNLGRIRRISTEHIWTSSPNRKGYLWIRLSLPGKRRVSRVIHRLVLETFRGPPLPGQSADHINEDITDNRLTNLEWVTSLENTRRATSRGVYRGENNGRAKVTEADVRIIRRLRWETGQSYATLAKLFGISKSQVLRIVNGQRWNLPGTD